MADFNSISAKRRETERQIQNDLAKNEAKFPRNTDESVYYIDDEENAKRGSIDYWNDRADNLQSRARRGNTHRLKNSDIEQLYDAHNHGKDEWIMWMQRYNKNKFTPEDLVREYNYRKNIIAANGDPNKIANVNNAYVRNEWIAHNQSNRAELEKEGKSYDDWLLQTYGTKEDPAQSFRYQPKIAQSSQILNETPVSQQDNTQVVNPTLHRMAEDGIRRRNL